MDVNVLTLAPRRTLVTLGETPSEVSSWDVVIDGQSLPEWIRWVGDDELGLWMEGRVGTLGGPFLESYRRAVVAKLLGRTSGVETPLYVCPCGDLECGAVLVDVVAKGTRVIWENIRWRGMTSGLPTFRFEAGPYRRLVSGA